MLGNATRRAHRGRPGVVPRVHFLIADLDRRDSPDRYILAVLEAGAYRGPKREDRRLVAGDVFVGRQRQLDQLDGFLRKAMAGQGQIAFIAGEPGSGKTSLAREFARRAQDTYSELLVASGECNPQIGQGEAYLPFREALGLLLGNVDATLAKGAITPSGAARLKRGLLRVAGVCLDVGPLALMLVGGLAAMVVAQAGQVVLKNKGFLSHLDKLGEWQRKTDSEPPPLDQGQLLEQYTRSLLQLAVLRA